MSAVIDVSNVGGLGSNSPLSVILQAQDIIPGDEPSYQVCKAIYTSHPLGKKIIDSPIVKAMHRPRELSVSNMPPEIVDRFNEIWNKLEVDAVIADCARLARIYGISSIAIMPEDGKKPDEPLLKEDLWSGNIKFNVFDPLNTAGSMVGILDPNNPDFLKYSTIAVAGVPYAKNRTHIQLYEAPVYLSYTSSAYGYVGRSAFNRALYPLQSYVQSMITDHIYMLKAGVLVAKINQPGSIIDKIQQTAQNIRLNILKIAKVGNTVSIKPDEAIESLDLKNLEYQEPRRNILENIALSLDMPTQFLTSDRLSQGFGEGKEDSRILAGFIESIRQEMAPIYKFMDSIIQRVAWNPDFFLAIQSKEKDQLGGLSYDEFFFRCQRDFKALWPDALEPDRKEKAEYQTAQYECLQKVYETLDPICSGDNRVNLSVWFVDNANSLKELIPNELNLDFDEVKREAAKRDAEKDQEQKQLKKSRPLTSGKK